MRKLFIILFLFCFTVANSQVYYTGSKKETQRGKKIYFGTTSIYFSDSTTAYTSTGDSITMIRTLTSPFGLGFIYKRQTKEVMKLYWKVNLKYLGTTTTRLIYGFILYKNGSRIQFSDSQFEYTTFNYPRFQTVNYTTTGGAGYKIFEKNIDFSHFPSYDSLLVFVSSVYSALPTNPKDYFTFSKDDLYLEPINNDYGIIINKIVDWNSDMILPDTIYATEDNFLQLYNDEIAYTPLYKKDYVTYDWTTDIGQETDSCLNIYAPTAGNYNIKCVAKIGNYQFDSITSILKVEPKAVIGNYAGLCVGNSLTNNGGAIFQQVIDDSLNISYTGLGTKGTAPYKHEGISGWDFTLFLGNTSPFYLGGKIDFAQYITNLGQVPNFIRVGLGVNDAHSKTSNEMLSLCNQFVDSILNQTNVDVIIYMPPMSSATNDFWIDEYGDANYYETYVNRIHNYNKSILERFDNHRYSERVHVAYDGLVVNRKSSYVDYVHLTSPSGYKEMIKGQSNIINHINQ